MVEYFRNRNRSDTSWIRAVDEIQQKFDQVEQKQVKLERICEHKECHSMKLFAGFKAQLMNDTGNGNARCS